MRILLIQETDWQDKGPHQQHHLIERLVRRGHQARIIDYDICWHEKSTSSTFTERMEIDMPSKTIDDVKISLIRPRMLRIPVLCYLSVLLWHTIEILRQIKQFRPHVIVGMSIMNTAVALFFSKLFCIPFVYYWIDSYHDLIPEKKFSRVGLMIERLILKRADKVLAINDELAKYQIQLGAPKENVDVVAAGIATERFNTGVNGSETRSLLGIALDDILLLFMGWMYDFSGIKEVAHDIAGLDKSTSIKFLMVGKGDSRDEMIDLARRPEARGRILLQDWVEYRNLPKYVAASDICVLPAYNNEIMRHIVPIKIYEYMACGKPVIVTKLPGIFREFGEGNGIVYVDRAEDTVRKVLEIVKNGEVERLGALAEAFALRRGWKGFVRKFHGILADIIMTKKRNQ